MPNNKIIDLDRLSRFKDKLDNVLETKANVDGNYPTMTVGSADNLTPYGENSGASDTTPFVMQSSGGNSDVGSKAYLRALHGNSVSWNQLAPIFNSTDYSTSATIVYNQDGSASFTAVAQNSIFVKAVVSNTFFASHKYVIKVKAKGTASADVRLLQIYDGSNWSYIAGSDLNASNYKEYSTIVTMTANMTNNSFFRIIQDGRASGWTPTTIKDLCIFDLTKMGLDSITSVLEFNRLFPKPYYEYNAGTLLSCKVNGIKNVGYNALSLDRTAGTLGNYAPEQRSFAFDKYYVGLSRGNNYDPARVSNVNIGENSVTFTVSSTGNDYGIAFPVQVIACQTYTLETTITAGNSGIACMCFDKEGNYISQNKVDNTNTTKSLQVTIPNNCQTCVVLLYSAAVSTTLTFSNIAFHLTWDGSRTGYEPYEKWEYNLPNIELRSAGSVYDELKPDGTLIRRVGVYTFTGQESWYKGNAITGGGGYVYYFFNANSVITPAPDITSSQQIVSDKYIKPSNILLGWESYPVNSIFISGGALVITDSASDLATFKTNIANRKIQYSLATPTTEQTSNTYPEVQDIDDFGTQEFLYDSDIDIPIPQGNDFFYPVDYKAFVDSLGGRDDIQYDASKVVSQTQLQAYTLNAMDIKKFTMQQLLAATQNLDPKNIGTIDLGSIKENEWYYDSNALRFYTYNVPFDTSNRKILSSIYPTLNTWDATKDNFILVMNNGLLYIKDTTLNGSKSALVEKLQGQVLAYKKA